jgi:hypothetical protein
MQASLQNQLAALKTLSDSGVLEEAAYSRHQQALLADWQASRQPAAAQMAEHRLRLRAERGKDELRTKLAQVGEQQRELRALCEACAAEQAAVRVAELETKASISRHCAAVGRELASREHEAQSAVARAEATERDALGRHSRAAGVRREALAEAVAHGAAALSLPDGRDFIARGLSAIALLDAELAVPPGDAHAAIGAAAAPPIQDLLSGHPDSGR